MQSEPRYAAIMVPMSLDAGAQGRLKLAAELADRFSARLIGTAAQEIVTPLYFESAAAGVASIIELEERRIAEELAQAEKSFREGAGARSVEWRGHGGVSSAAFAVQHSRAADLIVVGRTSRKELPGAMEVDAGDVVMNAGRPILMVPPRVDRLSAKRVLVAWKDTREARRAVWDALPLLKKAADVSVIAFEAADAPAKDVGAYLRHHGVEVKAYTRPEPAGSIADELASIASREGADLLVCGAYGHARTREWVFGGVTRDLMDRAPLCCLMSH